MMIERMENLHHQRKSAKIQPDVVDKVNFSLKAPHQRQPQRSIYHAKSHFYEYLVPMESWGRYIGVNLWDKQLLGDFKIKMSTNQNAKPPGGWFNFQFHLFSIHFWRIFLFINLIKEFIILMSMVFRSGYFKQQGDSNDDEYDRVLLFYMGDLFVLYDLHLDRFALHMFDFCWGFHATFIYFWITRSDGKIRKWLLNFDKLFTDTAHYVDKELDPKSQKQMLDASRFARKFIKWSTITAMVLVMGLNVFGLTNNLNQKFLSTLDQSYREIVMITTCLAWLIIHMVWLFITFIINLTSFGHHFLLCRAIHLRFDEIKTDLEYSLLSGKENPGSIPDHLSGLIIKHYFVCDMVKQANQHLKIYLFIFFIIFAPHLCFTVYQIILSDNFSIQGRILLAIAFLICDFFQVYFVSVLSAKITPKSFQSYYAMHGVNRFDNLPENIQLQSTLFMQRISNTVVGLTILDSFVLTGGLISSILTAIVTYFSVILENS